MRFGLVSTVVALSGFAGQCAAGPVANLARHQLATSGAYQGALSPLYVTDGKVGPENRLVTNPGGRHRVNIFFPEPVTIGSLHVYSTGYDGAPVEEFDVFYMDDNGFFVAAPGGSVVGNTSTALNVMLSAPVTTSRIRLNFDDNVVRLDEVAVFPPNGGAGYPIGTDIDLHGGRQHRVAMTPASSTAPGSRRRAIVDGFVNDTDYWATTGAGPHIIELDMSDPPETAPVTVRTTTTPLLLGGVHVYAGLSDGTFVPSVGKFQTFDETSGSWSDIAGSNFTNNMSVEFELLFDQPVETARIRFVSGDGSGIVVREIVPLPPRDGLGWPLGTSVVRSDRPDYRVYDDDFHTIDSSDGSSMLTGGSGPLVLEATVPGVSQQYQVLLDVGTETYRIRSRLSGDCLAVVGASRDAGAGVEVSPYGALPHQRWLIVEDGGAVQIVNAFSGMALAAGPGQSLIQTVPIPGDPTQLWSITRVDGVPKKGTGGFPDAAGMFGTNWAYNWGKDDTFPISVNYWPMQWGSFFWKQWPEMTPLWKRSSEPLVLMGYNEPDGAEQASIPVETGVRMWPRLEAQDLPLLAPAPVNATNAWITDFMNEVDAHELRVEYTAVHWYSGPNPDNFINVLTNARNAFGRDVIVTEFSVVDWSDTNSWNDDQVYNFFLEVFWRMELLPWVRRYAIFIFTDDPANNISDNRGELFFDDGSLTPEGKLFGAWDGDTTIRTDTVYHLHCLGSRARVGAVAGAGATKVGDRADDGDDYRWLLEPGGTPGSLQIRSVSDGGVLAVDNGGVSLEPAGLGGPSEFLLDEAEHGWFYLDNVGDGSRLRSTPALTTAAATRTADDVRWRLVPVFEAPPGPPRGVVAESVGLGMVEVRWAEHGFRDLESFSVYRQESGGGSTLVADGVTGTSVVIPVSAPGSYTFAVSAVGDTGESELSAGSTVAVESCDADFNGDFELSEDDVVAAVTAIDGGLDFDEDGMTDFFDTIDFLGVFDVGCP